MHGDHSHLAKLKETPHKIISVKKAKNSTAVIYRKMNVREYPDLHLTNINFDLEQKISNTNPQQSEYIWPTIEKIEWTSYEGKQLEGLIYKPENFDSTKSYPMMVYFYELYNERYNIHYIPKPTASIIYPTEYTSAGYVVFIPDVRYDSGYPARGAYDCIMSGTDEVLKKYANIDSTRMGLQGQSWGGYQTAQLVTMTNRYKAAMAGAPVSNMFSAYGGIRWGSGLNRQFQYEKTQSRIGKTIWEAPELYVENSPIFGIPEIETPLLIMHNDGDGAVPWYQGIEMFVGMKRLGKPVWMLNYNGDQHNLMQNANRVDLSIRMRQFFDYYLQNKPAPKWLIEGIPAVEKGEDYGLEDYQED
jgi:dipeptidyl aminopeptidase/acylaminoacyl peptidase